MNNAFKTSLLLSASFVFFANAGTQTMSFKWAKGINEQAWKPVTNNFPGPIEDAQLIYHPPGKAMLLIGGTPVIQDSVKSDVWKWDGKTWSRMAAEGPGARVFFEGALNTKTKDIQLFAGAGLGRDNYLTGDLWSFNGRKWSRIFNNDIGTHDHHNMVYADHLDAFVLYGGNRDHVFDTITWLMQNGQFSRLNIRGPGVRYQSGMVYDKNRKKVVLYGGGEKADELWEFDGQKWEKVVTSINPGIKLYHHMAYDENLKAVVLHGGLINHNPQDPKNLEPPITWLWNGKNWRKIAEERIYSLAIGYNPIRKSVMAYGYNDGNKNVTRNLALWELKNYKWVKIADYGKWNMMEYLERHLEQKPDDPMALLTYANALRDLNRLPEAEIILKKIEPQKMPQKANVLLGLIRVLMAQSKWKEAESYIFKMEHSGLPGAKYLGAVSYYNLACAWSLAGNKDKAFEALNKSADLDYNKKKDYESDPDLESLKPDARWKTLLERLK